MANLKETLSRKLDAYLMKGYATEYHEYTKDFKAPDWRKYRVEDSKYLMQTQQELAYHGLKDPWLRNEVWRYLGAGQKSTAHAMKFFYLRGMKLGVVCGLSLFIVESTFFPGKNRTPLSEMHH